MSKFSAPDLSRSQKIGSAATAPDRQSQSLAASAVTDEKFVTIFQEKFSGTEVLNNQEKVRQVSLLANTIRHEKTKQIESAIAIGRAFCQTEGVFSRDEWTVLMKHTQELFGMTKHTASMYKKVAEAIDSGLIQKEICPPSFSTAYVLTTYNPRQLELAKKEGLINPELTRAEAVAFKKKHANRPKSRIKKSNSEKRRKQLIKEQTRLFRRLEAIEKELLTLKEAEERE